MPKIKIGDLVYLHSDKEKGHTRKRYIVVSIEQPWCIIRKFVGNQLRNTGYKVLLSECYNVQSPPLVSKHLPVRNKEDSEDEILHTADKPSPPVELVAPCYPDETRYSPNLKSTENQSEENMSVNKNSMTEFSEFERRSERNRKPPSYLKDYETS